MAGRSLPRGRVATTRAVASGGASNATTCVSAVWTTVVLGGGGAGAGLVGVAFWISASGSFQCGRTPGLVGLLESNGPFGFVSPHRPGQNSHFGASTSTISSAASILGPLPSARSNQWPVQC